MVATKKRPARRKTPVRGKRPARKAIARRPPRVGKLGYRLGVWFASNLASFAEDRRATTRSRRDAAILRATHQGCPKCGGTGTLYTKGKDGRLTGSKPCPAKPTVTKVSRTQVALAARFGVDKRSGLIGWSCPCGKREKPRYRDAKTATKALRTHEKRKHGGVSVGGTWYAQQPAAPKPADKPKAAEGMPR